MFLQLTGDKDTPICGVAKHTCVAAVEKQMMKDAFRESINDVEDASGSCNCLPACVSINYDVEISPSKFNLGEYFRGLMPTCVFPEYNLTSELRIYFKEIEFVTSKRVELYGLSNFLAACGGLLSLFIGVTALSFVEIFYYVTLRLMWTLKMYRYGKQS